MEFESFLTPKQLKSYHEIFSRKGISSASQTCHNCYWMNYFIYKALMDLRNAVDIYDASSHPCDDVSAGIAMRWANYFLNKAEYQSKDAYQYCYCTSATRATSNLNTSLRWMSQAINNTINHCDPNAPWMYRLKEAHKRAELVANSGGMQACIDQTCNN